MKDYEEILVTESNGKVYITYDDASLVGNESCQIAVEYEDLENLISKLYEVKNRVDIEKLREKE